jgi:hypothetical protein
MTAFLPKPSDCWALFGDDLLQRPEACGPLMEGLLGRKRKPWDCVGTAEEVALLLHLCRRSYARHGLELPPSLRGAAAEADAERGAAAEARIMNGSGVHAVPAWAQAAVCADASLFQER